jgi:hypothetical protein
VGALTLAREAQYSGAVSWLALALLWPLSASAQSADDRPASASAAPPATSAAPRRGAVPQSVQVLDELIERLTDAPLYRDNDAELLLDGPQTHAAMLDAIAAAEHPSI